MKNKILMITAALAVMMALTGIAAAGPFNLEIVGNSNPILLAPGQSVVMDLKATLIPEIDNGVTYASTASVTCSLLNPTCNPGDISVSANNLGPVTWPTYFQANSVTVTRSLTPIDPSGYYYIITVNSGPAGSVVGESGVGTRTAQSIPEFATVAIPIAAVLGLVFFFQQRKNKKEE